MSAFEKWWQETYETPFSSMGGALKLGFKEVAQAAWTEAYTLGYRKGVEATEYDDTK
jgi:hypothetical protein